MRCSGCAAENAPDCRFCSECGARLVSICPSCRFENAPAAKFCGGCGARLIGAAAPAVTQAAPGSYTPKPLAERILRSRGALEGERKQVTVLFADIKGSMELIQGTDPEDARRMLDPTMTYSCAVFDDPDAPLEQAQRNKLELVCQKLELGPADRVLEVGTGWGSFALYAAASRGCHITTTTISREQHDYVQRRVAEAGLNVAVAPAGSPAAVSATGWLYEPPTETTTMA